MGSFDMTCCLSGLGVASGTRVFLLALVEGPKGHRESWEPVCAPVRGIYADYGLVYVPGHVRLPQALLGAKFRFSSPKGDPWEAIQIAHTYVSTRRVVFAVVREDALDLLIPAPAEGDVKVLSADSRELLEAGLWSRGIHFASRFITNDIVLGIASVEDVARMTTMIRYLDGPLRRGLRPTVALAGSQSAGEDFAEQARALMLLAGLAQNLAREAQEDLSPPAEFPVDPAGPPPEPLVAFIHDEVVVSSEEAADVLLSHMWRDQPLFDTAIHLDTPVVTTWGSTRTEP